MRQVEQFLALQAEPAQASIGLEASRQRAPLGCHPRRPLQLRQPGRLLQHGLQAVVQCALLSRSQSGELQRLQVLQALAGHQRPY